MNYDRIKFTILLLVQRKISKNFEWMLLSNEIAENCHMENGIMIH